MPNAFRDWVKQVGIPEVALKLDKSQHCVRFWLLRRGYPQVETMRTIVKLTGGKVTLDDIVDACRPKGERA